MTDLVRRRIILASVVAAGAFILGAVGYGTFVSSVVESAGGTATSHGPAPRAGLVAAGLAVGYLVVDWLR